ncbi:unnamed protein product [Caenorhabditis sp. 36 PRJEB53466]|nr:unnamed protein product [Caenorhabditis sp. 36 PRJEB53466]
MSSSTCDVDSTNALLNESSLLVEITRENAEEYEKNVKNEINKLRTEFQLLEWENEHLRREDQGTGRRERQNSIVIFDLEADVRYWEYHKNEIYEKVVKAEAVGEERRNAEKELNELEAKIESVQNGMLLLGSEHTKEVDNIRSNTLPLTEHNHIVFELEDVIRNSRASIEHLQLKRQIDEFNGNVLEPFKKHVEMENGEKERLQTELRGLKAEKSAFKVLTIGTVVLLIAFLLKSVVDMTII